MEWHCHIECHAMPMINRSQSIFLNNDNSDNSSNNNTVQKKIPSNMDAHWFKWLQWIICIREKLNGDIRKDVDSLFPLDANFSPRPNLCIAYISAVMWLDGWLAGWWCVCWCWYIYINTWIIKLNGKETNFSLLGCSIRPLQSGACQLKSMYEIELGKFIAKFFVSIICPPPLPPYCEGVCECMHVEVMPINVRLYFDFLLPNLSVCSSAVVAAAAPFWFTPYK